MNANDLNWGAKYGYIWAGSNAIAFGEYSNATARFPTDLFIVFFFLLIPETKGRSLEEIDEMFVNKVPRSQFKTYQCVSSERAREIAEQQVDELPKAGTTVVHAEKISV